MGVEKAPLPPGLTFIRVYVVFFCARAEAQLCRAAVRALRNACSVLKRNGAEGRRGAVQPNTASRRAFKRSQRRAPSQPLITQVTARHCSAALREGGQRLADPGNPRHACGTPKPSHLCCNGEGSTAESGGAFT